MKSAIALFTVIIAAMVMALMVTAVSSHAETSGSMTLCAKKGANGYVLYGHNATTTDKYIK